MSQFKVMAQGEPLAGRDLAEAKAGVARLFKLDVESPQLAAIFSGRAIRLRGGLSQEQAERFKAAVEAAGLACEVVAEEEGAVETVQPAPAAVAPRAVPEPQSTPRQEPYIGAAAEPEYNPYQQPSAALEREPEAGEFELVEPNKLSAGAGWAWIKEGLFYFKQRPLLWLGAVLFFWGFTMVLSMVPLISIVATIVSPVLTAGFMMIAYKQYRGEVSGFSDMLAGFRNNFLRLLGVGGLYLLGMVLAVVAVMAVLFLVAGVDGMAALGGGQLPFDPLMIPLMVVLMLGLFTLLVMAYWFAPALVMLSDLGPLQAMRMSFKGCLRNWLPFLVYGAVCIVILFVVMVPLFLMLAVFAPGGGAASLFAAMVPFMLGMLLVALVLTPTIMASIFAGYRQIYTNSAFE